MFEKESKMSTEERWNEVLGKCPCGDGTVRQEVISPNNMYSKGSRKVSLHCEKCLKAWDLHGRILTLRSSRTESDALQGQLSTIERDIVRVKDEVMSGYFTRQGIKTMKAEWEEMKRLGFYTESLGTFRSRMGSVATGNVYQFSGMNVDQGWLMDQAGLTTAKARLEDLYKKEAEARAALKEARGRIVKKLVDDLAPEDPK